MIPFKPLRIPSLFGIFLLASSAATAQVVEAPMSQVPEARPGAKGLISAPSESAFSVWTPPVDGAERPVPGGRSPIVVTPGPGSGVDVDAARELLPAESVDREAFLRSRVFHDFQRGTHWARGIDYKASANKSGMTFIPFLGSDAPRNYDFHMSLRSATLAGEPLKLASEGKFIRKGDRWSLQRGAIEVVYDLSPESIEQSFVLNAGAGEGELILEVAVVSDLSYEDRSGVAYYTNELGGLTYDHAVVVDAAGKRLKLEIEACQSSVRLVVPAAYMARAVAPVVVDPVLTTYRLGSTSIRHLQNPDVAYDQGTSEFAYVYNSQFSATDFDISIETHDAVTGALSGIETIDYSADNVKFPSVASDNTSDQYLVVSRRETAGGRWEIIGRTVDATSLSSQSPVFVIGSAAGSVGDANGNDNLRPDVGGKSQGSPMFKVVWGRRIFLGGLAPYINARSRSVIPVVPLSTSVAPSMSSLRAVSHSNSNNDTQVKVSKSSGMASVAEWRIMFLRTTIVGGAQALFSGVTADDNTVISTASNVGDISSTLQVNDVDLSDGLLGIPQPFTSSPVYAMALYTELGSTGAEVLVLGIQNDQIFGLMVLNEREHQDLGHRPRFPVLSTFAERFAVSYVEYNPTSTEYTCYMTSFDLDTQFEFGINGRREVVQGLGGTFDFQPPGSASRYSGGDYGSQVLATAVSRWGGARWEPFATTFQADLGPTPGHQFCIGSPNSTGDYGFLTMEGSSQTTGLKTLRAFNLSPFQFGYFLASPGGRGTFVPPGSVGPICLMGAPLGRYNQAAEVFNTGISGTASLVIDPAALRGPGGDIVGQSGQEWNFQAWHRQAGGLSNFTNAFTITFD